MRPKRPGILRGLPSLAGPKRQEAKPKYERLIGSVIQSIQKYT
jgi:hypothetical protein